MFLDIKIKMYTWWLQQARNFKLYTRVFHHSFYIYIYIFLYIYIYIFMCMFYYVCICVCIYGVYIWMYIFRHCVYKRACMSIHILLWLYCMSCTYRKKKNSTSKILNHLYFGANFIFWGTALGRFSQCFFSLISRGLSSMVAYGPEFRYFVLEWICFQ